MLHKNYLIENNDLTDKHVKLCCVEASLEKGLAIHHKFFTASVIPLNCGSKSVHKDHRAPGPLCNLTSG